MSIIWRILALSVITIVYPCLVVSGRCSREEEKLANKLMIKIEE